MLQKCGVLINELNNLLLSFYLFSVSYGSGVLFVYVRGCGSVFLISKR